MTIKLVMLRADETLSDLQTTLTQTEDLGFELITFAKGVVGGQSSNTATFMRLTPGTEAGPLTLLEASGAKSLPQQETDVNNGETSEKKLISYAAVLVQGNETNVAVYRG